jgi:hypothetical protein
VRYSQSAALPALADAIASIWELDAAGTPLNEPIFPDGRIEVIVHLGNRPTVAGESAQQPGLMVVGQMTAALRLEHADRMHAVGLTPKRFLRTTRFQRALALLREGYPPVDVAARCGYADQPHLAREFRAFAGVPARDVKPEDVALHT